MGKKHPSGSRKEQRVSKPSVLVDTRVIYCGDNLDQLKKFPDGCVDLIYIDPPFNSNRNYEVFWGETKEKRSFEDRHASTQAYIEFMRPRCVEVNSDSLLANGIKEIRNGKEQENQIDSVV